MGRDGLENRPTGTPRLAARGICKWFPGVQALQRVDLRVWPGEVLALVGENGAGKSTLMKILAGIETPDAGELHWDGQPIIIDSVRTAEAQGIALIHQELNLADNLDVGANLFLGREPRRWGCLIDRPAIDQRTRQLLQAVGLNISPRTIVGSLPLGRQQLVEIAKALAVNARVLIMDEPTSSLSTSETAVLFGVVRELRTRGVSIIYISHRLGEIQSLADRVTVLRDGQNAGELRGDAIQRGRLVQLMVGRDVSQLYARRSRTPGRPMLEVSELRTSAQVQPRWRFQVRSGEIVGLAGLVGAGRTELLRVLFGIDPAVGGEIRIAGQRVSFASPAQAIQAGVALVPEDRQLAGLIVDLTVQHNLGLASLRRQRRALGLIDRRHERAMTDAMIRTLNIKTPHRQQLARYLSGGNQQKVVLGKWLALQPRVLLLDEPTRGIDVGAKEEIYQLMERLAEQGVAILFASSEMEEILGMSDRVLVMHEGRMRGELSREQLSEEAVMHLATGGAAYE
jgi:ribose transport system ATP-binding protein